MKKTSPYSLNSKWLVRSVCLHLVLVAVFFLFSAYEPGIPKTRPIVNITIVQKGKRRDESLLPRQVAEVDKKSDAKEDTQVAPPKVEKIQKESKPDKHTLVKKETPPKPEKKAGSQQVSALDALKKLRKEFEAQGDENGLEEGNSVFGDLVDSYENRVKAILKENFVLPSFISQSEAKNLKVKINIIIDPQGHPGLVSVKKESRYKEYDNAVVSTVKLISTFGPPPLLAQNKYKKYGLPVTMCAAIECPED